MTIKSKMKNKWINVPERTIESWIGDYLLAAMVIGAFNQKQGIPNRIGKIKDMKIEKDGSGTIPYQAQWD